MSKKILLPELGEGVTEGELIKWLVAEKDTIQSDQVIAEIMTDKASIEVPSPISGVVKSLLVKEGESIQVGHALLTLESSSEEKEIKDRSNDSRKNNTGIKQKSSDTNFITKQSSPRISDNQSVAAPLVRRLAKNLGVDLSQITGSGPGGRILEQDILKSASSNKIKNSKSENEEILPFIGVRKKIAERMQLSKQLIPHFTILESANVEKLDEIKTSVREMLKDQNIKLTYLSFVMKALCRTVMEFPHLNASINDEAGKIILKKNYHVGFAVDTPRGLLVPVVKNVDKKSLKEIAVDIQNLALRAREGNIKPHEMSEGTITITNIGSVGGHSAIPIINPPEVAILGMYRLMIQPHWNGQTFQPQKTMNFSLTCDHRLIDGAEAARAIRFFIQSIEQPLCLFI